MLIIIKKFIVNYIKSKMNFVYKIAGLIDILIIYKLYIIYIKYFL